MDEQFNFTHRLVNGCTYTARRNDDQSFTISWTKFNGCAAGYAQYNAGEVAAMLFAGEWVRL